MVAGLRLKMMFDLQVCRESVFLRLKFMQNVGYFNG